jgi:hypothetical protein
MLFPMRVAPLLRDLRGPAWRKLVDHALMAPEASLEELAFSLMMIRLASCLTCHTDSFRAMRGCTNCATQVIRRYRGNDSELIECFERAREEVKSLMRSGSLRVWLDADVEVMNES